MLTGTTALAPGVYPVADTYATNTVSAGSVDGYIYGSFAGFITSDNKISIPLWNGQLFIIKNGVKYNATGIILL